MASHVKSYLWHVECEVVRNTSTLGTDAREAAVVVVVVVGHSPVLQSQARNTALVVLYYSLYQDTPRCKDRWMDKRIGQVTFQQWQLHTHRHILAHFLKACGKLKRVSMHSLQAICCAVCTDRKDIGLIALNMYIYFLIRLLSRVTH